MSADFRLDDYRDYWRELPGSPKETYDVSGGPSVTRQFHGPWDTRFDFLNAFLVNPFYEEIPGVQVLRIQLSPRQGAAPGREVIDDLTVQHVEYPGFPSSGGAECTVEYGVLTAGSTGQGMESEVSETMGDNGFLTYRTTGAAELTTVPGRNMTWETDGATCPTDMIAPIREIVTSHIITWNRASVPDWSLFDRLAGKINSIPFRMPVANVMCEPGTLLLESYDSDITYDFRNLDDPWVWNLNFQFARKRNLQRVGAALLVRGWNYLARINSEGDLIYDRPTFDVQGGGKQFLYYEDALHLLFG